MGGHSNQRNIRIKPELWAYVQSKAKPNRRGVPNCSALIARWIRDRMYLDRCRKRITAESHTPSAERTASIP